MTLKTRVPKPELQVVTLSPEFGATHSRTKFDPFFHFCPGTPGTPEMTHFLAKKWVTFWAILSGDYGKKGAKMENRGPKMGSKNWPKMTQKWVIWGKSIHGRVQGNSRTKPVLSPRARARARARGILKMTHFWPKTDTRLSSHCRCYPLKKWVKNGSFLTYPLS